MDVKTLLQLPIVLAIDVVLFPPALIVFVIYSLLVFLVKVGINLIYNREGKLELMEGKDANTIDPQGKATPLFGVICRGKMDEALVKLRRVTTEMMVHSCDRGDKMAENFTRYVVRVGPFLYWKHEDNFRIEDHVNAFPKRILKGEEDLRILLNELRNAPRILPEGKSQWRMDLYPVEYEDGKERFCYVLWINHGLVDGVSTAKIFAYFCDGKFDQSSLLRVLKTTESQPKWKICLTKLLSLVCLPYVVFNAPRKLSDPFFVPSSGKVLSGETIIYNSKPLNMNMVKEVKDGLKCSVTEVLLGCLAQSMKKSFQKHWGFIPKDYQIAMPAAVYEGQPKRYGNSTVSGMTISFPINASSATEATKIIRNQTRSLIKKMEVYGLFIISKKVANFIPYQLFALSFSNIPLGTSITNSPLFDSCESFLGGQMEEFLHSLPIMGNAGLSMLIVTVNNKARISFTTDKALIPGLHALEDISNLLVQEIENLHENIVRKKNKK